MRKGIIIFLTIIGVFFAAGCAGYGDSEEAAPAAPGEEEAEETEPADEAGHDEETEMEEEETETGTEVEEGTEAEEPAGGAGAEIIDVEIRDFTYIPDTLTVKVGQTVRWLTTIPPSITWWVRGWNRTPFNWNRTLFNREILLRSPLKKKAHMIISVHSTPGWKVR